MSRSIIIAALLVLLVVVYAQAEVNPGLIEHRLKRRESICTDQCMKMTKTKRVSNIKKCMTICSDIVMNKKATEEVIKKAEAEQVPQESPVALSDLTADQQQQEATKQLWELYHTNLKQLLTTGSFNPGFQLLSDAIDLTSIRSFGGDQMPANALSLMNNVQDYDNMGLLAMEVMQSSTVGPFRKTNGIMWVDEYKSFLSGVQGADSVTIPDPDHSESAKKTLLYEYTLNNCTEKYMMANPAILQMYSMEQYSNIFCPQVKHAERAMFAMIGMEQARMGNNPAYAAAVALGMAQGLYTSSTAFKKTQSFRMMEWDCVQSQNDPSIPYRASPRQFEFNYNFHNWKNTQTSSSFSVSVGYGVFNAKVGQQKEKVTGLDLTQIGGVSVGFADLKYIPLYPGEWYSSTAMRDFRYYPRTSASSPISRYFGKEGTMTLFPKGLYVAVNPNIGLNVATSSKETFMKSTQTAIEVGATIFGANIGGTYGKAAKVEEGTEKSGNTMITIKSTSCQPQLFAVDNHYIY